MKHARIVTIVGARPQFIKAAVVSRLLREAYTEVLVHTGQHHDYNMSDIFFDELDIPKPDYNLGISGGSHGKMTGAMIASIEDVLQREAPDAVLIYGDTNSTLAGALAAVKLHIPVCHLEAGVRLHTFDNPEEINRVVADHVSSLLLYCTASAEENLAREGLADKGLLIGDPMYDAFLYYGDRLTGRELSAITGLDGAPVATPERYYYMTCHRQENTDSDETLLEILSAMERLDAPTIYPVHPRNRERARALCAGQRFRNVLLTEPVGYLTSIALIKGAEKIVTDSGGLQREAFYAGKQCVTVFDRVIWPETMVDNRNQLSRPVAAELLQKLPAKQRIDPSYRPFGDGHAGKKAVAAITAFLKEHAT